MELNIKGKHLFDLIMLVSKLKMKEECLKLFKEYSKLANRKNNCSIKLNMALGDLENNEENMTKILLENENLKKELENVQSESKEYLMDVVFLVIDKMAYARKEILGFLGELYSVKPKDLEELPPSELIEKIKAVVLNEEMQRAFISIFK